LTIALFIFAAIAGLAGVVAIAIVLNRELAASAIDQDALRALGTTRGQRTGMSGARVLVVAVGGALIAIAGAIAASPLMPFGVARRADPDPGLHADWIVLALGAVVVVAVVAAIAIASAARATRVAVRDRPSAVGTRVANTVAGIGLSPAAETGLRMATEP